MADIHTGDPLGPADRIAVIRAESQRFAEALAETPDGSPCPTCPDWTATDLLWHLTEVHTFWSRILEQDVRSDAEAESVEEDKPERPGTIAEMLPVRARATDALLDQLAALDDAAPRWSWWEPDQTVGFTRRMQTYEATMHRVDAELTAGVPVTPLRADVAAGAVDHCVDVMWGWMPPWASYEPLAAVEFVAATAEGGEGPRWLVEVGHWTGTGPTSGREFDVPRAVRAGPDARPTATATGSARDLALWAWTRGDEVALSGDERALAAVRALIAHGIQ